MFFLVMKILFFKKLLNLYIFPTMFSSSSMYKIMKPKEIVKEKKNLVN